MPDLNALNHTERETLALLAQGHTAKSIATLTGRSVASVNERLREARRKTGLGSSRELARLMAAQENWDEEIGVAGQSPESAATATGFASRGAGSLFVGGSIMALVAIAAVLMLSPAPQDTSRTPDPLLGDLVGTVEDTMPRLYQRVRAETRDVAWAPQAEAKLRSRFAAVPGVAPDQLRVTCGATLCEVAGMLITRDGAAMNATLETLQDKALRDDVRHLGFTGDGPMGFGGEGSTPTRSRFYAYWTRKP